MNSIFSVLVEPLHLETDTHGGEVEDLSRPRLSIHLSHRPRQPARDRDGRHFLCGCLGVVAAKDNVTVRGMNHEFECHGRSIYRS